MYDVINMPWDWPVDVNYHEAKAFCKWKGPEYRMPTEAEHNRIRGDPVSSYLAYKFVFMYFMLIRHLLLIFCVTHCTAMIQMLICLDMDHLMLVFVKIAKL